MRTVLLLLLGLLVTMRPIVACAQVPDHPRLIVPNRDLHALTHPSGPWETWTERERASVLAYRSIITAAEDLCGSPIGGLDWTKGFVDEQTAFYHNIKTLAMAHLLRRGEPYDNAYIDYACSTLDLIRTTNYPMWFTEVDPYNTDLNTGELLAGWALAFDWLHQDMTATQVSNNIQALFHLLDNQDYHNVVTGLKDNNHIAVCFGGRGLACLALETHCTPQQEASRQAWLTEASSRVIDYFDWAFDSQGAGFEGVFYSMYGLNTSLPFGLAVDRLDHLPSSQRVDVRQRNVQQAGTWLCYEQLPFDPAAGTPINDTDRPPWDLNNTPMRPYPWLMAFGTRERPSGAKLLFLTQYPPKEWGTYLEMPFDPDAPDGNACFFSKIKRPTGNALMDKNRSAVDVLLGWPEDATSEDAFYESLRPSRAFTGRGIIYFREEALRIENGNLSGDPDGWLLTFECQLPPGWTQGGHQGHRQNDTSHYLYYWNKHPIAYDSGFRSFSAAYHNARMIRAPGQTWREPTLEARGTLVRHIEGTGIAPSFAIGDDAAGWNWSAEMVDRAQRSFLVVPRTAGRPPFVLIYDDLDFSGNNAWESRFFWHTAEEATMTVVGQDRARSTMSETVADMSFLQPVPASLTVATVTPVSQSWPPHPRLTADFGASPNPNVIALLEPYPGRTSRTLAVAPIPHSNPKTFAYAIEDGADYYVVVLRQADAQGVATLSVDGRILTTDSRHTVLHFNPGTRSWADISAGAMAGGRQVWYDDRLVMGIYNDSLAGDLTFDADEVVVSFDAGGSSSPEYYVGPVIPGSALVSGMERETDMIDFPHPLRSSFPTPVCRSPNNGVAPPGWQYTAEVHLRTAEGTPVSGWPVDRISMDIQNCQNPRSNLMPAGPSDSAGLVVWVDGLDSGGSHRIAGGAVVVLDIAYGGDAVGRLHSYDSVTSPDEDGDMDVDEDDFVIWNQAFEQGEPLYIGDLDRDGAITWDDYGWLQAHGLPGYHAPPPLVPVLKVSNPSRREAAITCYFPAAGHARLDVFDVQGRLVRTLLDQPMTRGPHSLQWDGRNAKGMQAGSGIYLLRLRQGGTTRVVRTVVLR